MIPNPDTLARIREQADAFARQRIESFPGGEMRDIDKLLVLTIVAALRSAFIAGADAGYTAALAERREK